MNAVSRPRRAPLLWLLLPYMGGVVLAKFALSLGNVAAATLAIAAALAAFLARARPAAWGIAIALALAGAGALRYQLANPPQAPLDGFPPREAELVVRIATLFGSDDPARAAGIGFVESTPTHLQRYLGRKLFFSGARPLDAPRPVEGESFLVRGVLEPLPPTADRSGFERYLANQSALLGLRRGALLEKTGDAPAWRYLQESARQRLAAILSRNKRPESQWTGAYRALLTGQKGELRPEQKDLFLRNGTMHLFAISGLHIGVIAGCIHAVLLLARTPRALLPALALAIVLLFVLVTGGSASSWRAFLMIACLYLCHATRRQVSPLSGLSLAALIYLLLLPNELFQAGFQMSYLTVASILLFGLSLARNLKARIDPLARIPRLARGPWLRALDASRQWLLDGLAISVAATLCASLLGALYFGMVPLYGALVNVVAVPLASLALVAGFCSIAVGLIGLAPLSYLFNNAAITLIAGIERFLEAAGALPFAAISTENASAAGVWAALLGCFLWIGYAYARGEGATLRWQMPPLAACVAATLWL